MWYKQAQESKPSSTQIVIKNFTDRNHVNRQIRRLEQLIDNIGMAANQAEGNHGECAKILQATLADKIMSSFPEACAIVNFASKRVYDAPLDAARACLDAIDIITKRIVELRELRNNFGVVSKKVQKYRKGLF
jgi:hypothetical protein